MIPNVCRSGCRETDSRFASQSSRGFQRFMRAQRKIDVRNRCQVKRWLCRWLVHTPINARAQQRDEKRYGEVKDVKRSQGVGSLQMLNGRLRGLESGSHRVLRGRGYLGRADRVHQWERSCMIAGGVRRCGKQACLPANGSWDRRTRGDNRLPSGRIHQRDVSSFP